MASKSEPGAELHAPQPDGTPWCGAGSENVAAQGQPATCHACLSDLAYVAAPWLYVTVGPPLP